jgi:hypothetical protein
MSRVLSGTGQYLTTSGAVLTAAPLTMACWGIHGATGVLDYAMMLGVSGATNNRFVLGVNASDQVFMESAAASASSAVTTATVPTSGWQHFAGVTASATSRFAYLNGTPGSVQTTSRVPSGINMLRVGAGGTASSLWTGTIAHCAVWNVALTDAEIAALAAGLSPLAMRPGALVAYWPYMGRDTADIDIVGRFDLTNTSTTSGADEPRLLWMPTRRIFIPVASGAPTQTGSGTADLLLPTATGAASRALKSTGTATLPLATATGAGKRDLKSTGTASLPLLTASGSGKQAKPGSGAGTLPLVTAAGTGSRALKATGTAGLLLPTATGAGSVTEPGVVTHSGSGTSSLPLPTGSGAGSFAEDISSGSGTADLLALVASGSGSFAAGPVTYSGSGAANLAALTATGTGIRVLLGSGAGTLPSLTATGRDEAQTPNGGDWYPDDFGLKRLVHTGGGHASLAMLYARGAGDVSLDPEYTNTELALIAALAAD